MHVVPSSYLLLVVMLGATSCVRSLLVVMASGLHLVASLLLVAGNAVAPQELQGLAVFLSRGRGGRGAATSAITGRLLHVKYVST